MTPVSEMAAGATCAPTSTGELAEPQKWARLWTFFVSLEEPQIAEENL